MTILDHNPINLNYQNEKKFVFKIKRAPALSFFCQTAPIPDIQLPAAYAATPSLRIPFQGDHLQYNPLVLSFKIDESLQNWLEMFNWITGIGNPENKKIPYDLIANNPDWTGYGVYTNLQLFVLDSQNNPTYIFHFDHAFPTSLSGPKFESIQDDVQFITSSVSFLYSIYHVTLANPTIV